MINKIYMTLFLINLYSFLAGLLYLIDVQGTSKQKGSVICLLCSYSLKWPNIIPHIRNMKHLLKYSMIHLPHLFSIFKKDKNKENFLKSLFDHENEIGRGRISVCHMNYKKKAVDDLMHMKTLQMMRIYKILKNISAQDQKLEKSCGSDVTLHIKEIPKSWYQDELYEAFLTHGELSLFCFSVNDRSAIVKYKSKQSCKKAIKFYEEFSHSPFFYMDWSEESDDTG